MNIRKRLKSCKDTTTFTDDEKRLFETIEKCNDRTETERGIIYSKLKKLSGFRNANSCTSVTVRLNDSELLILDAICDQYCISKQFAIVLALIAWFGNVGKGLDMVPMACKILASDDPPAKLREAARTGWFEDYKEYSKASSVVLAVPRYKDAFDRAIDEIGPVVFFERKWVEEHGLLTEEEAQRMSKEQLAKDFLKG